MSKNKNNKDKDKDKKKVIDDSDSDGDAGEFSDSENAKEEMQNQKLVLKPFDPLISGTPEIPPDATIGVFGARRTGKSFLTRMILWMMRGYFPFVYVITNTKVNKWYEQFLPPDCIVSVYDQEFIQLILDMQAEKVNKWRSGDTQDNPMICIIWDDCLPERMQWDSVFKDIYFFGRHLKIFNIMLTQYFYRIPRAYRGNIDFVFSMKQDDLMQLDGFWETIMGRRVDRYEFIDKFDKATNDQGFVLFDVANKDKPITENVYFGKAFDPGPFIMGCQQMWETLEGRKQLNKIKSGKAREEAEKQVEIENEAYFREIEKQNIETWRKQGNPPIPLNPDITSFDRRQTDKYLKFAAQKKITDNYY